MKNILLALVALIVLGGLYFIFTSAKGTDPVATPNNTNVDTSNENADLPNNTVSGMRAEENAVVATDQRPGSTVKVAQVYMAVSGYVVIHEDLNGEAGAILGSSELLQAGQTDKVMVTLTRPSKDGEKLWSMLHVEKNGNSSFEASTDTPVMSMLGGPISGWFEVYADAEENIEVTLQNSHIVH